MYYSSYQNVRIVQITHLCHHYHRNNYCKPYRIFPQELMHIIVHLWNCYGLLAADI